MVWATRAWRRRRSAGTASGAGRASRGGWACALAVALAPDDQGVAVVGQAVEGSAGEQAVAERLGPLVEGAVAGDDERLALVPFTDEVVEILSRLGRQWAEPE